MKEIKYLYHYTSIETLALILRNKTIRFGSLSYVDDIDEASTGDFGDFGRFCFVSCWTDDSEESIPLWNMYTPNMKGVRIKLPTNPFMEYEIKSGEWGISQDFKAHIDLHKHYGDHQYSVNPPYRAQLLKVEYTEDLNLIYPKVYSYIQKVDGWSESVNLEDIGKYKRKSWEFQRELRYKLFFVPWKFEEISKCSSYEEQKQLFSRFKYYKLPFNYFDLTLCREKMGNMEILLGPKVSETERIIVNALINQYNRTAVIRDSALRIR